MKTKFDQFAFVLLSLLQLSPLNRDYSGFKLEFWQGRRAKGQEVVLLKKY